MDMVKVDALRSNAGDFEEKVLATSEAYKDLDWWETSLCLAFKCISDPNQEVTMQSEASPLGWGIV